MLRRSKLFVAITAIVTAVISLTANAAVVHWTLDGVTLSDSETLTGSFDFDRDAGASGVYSNVAISNSGSTTWPATLFTTVPMQLTA